MTTTYIVLVAVFAFNALTARSVPAAPALAPATTVVPAPSSATIISALVFVLLVAGLARWPTVGRDCGGLINGLLVGVNVLFVEHLGDEVDSQC